MRTSLCKLEGVVTKMEWINPHSWIHIDVTTPDGRGPAVDGRGRCAERAAAPRLEQQLVADGHEDHGQGFQAKDGSIRANGRDITFADGSKLFVGSSGTGAPDERPEQ